jgi:dolichol-phosphate mannosyltransferase
MQNSVVIPTYNEAGNITLLLERLSGVLPPKSEIIIVDDNSPDGTGKIAEKMKKTCKNLRVIHRKGKQGIGSAYKDGFRMARGEYIFEMDADLSHDPKYIPMFLEKIKSYDCVIGSRYEQGGGVPDWGIYRRLISRGANTLASLILGLHLPDVTSGYRVYRKSVLEKIDLDSIKSNFYAFQVEIALRVKKAGFSIGTIPIVFPDRRKGTSKMGVSEILRFFIMILRLAP